ncbi:MAG: LysR family transcriptional regulator [Eggerthellaceae bacterium]|nr:LysR family transcriptional regulator [Eggerthellaceae bacterium]
MPVNIEYLHYFLDVAKTKSIAQAAKLNFISSQGMSRAMGELEKELGCQLFIRYSNKLSLSPVGEELVDAAARVVDDYGALLDLAAAKSQPDHTPCGSILLDCQNVATLAFFTKEAKDYLFGTREIIFRESQNSQIRQSLLTSLAERPDDALPAVGLFCFFNQERHSEKEGIAALEERGFRYRPYLRTYDKAMASAASPLAQLDVLTDEDIATRPLVATNSHLYSVLAKRFGRDAIALSSANFALRRQMVESDSAVSFLPAIAELTMPEERDFVLRDMERPYEVEIGFAGRERDLERPCFRRLIDILDDFYRAHQDSGLYTLCE